MQLLLTIFAVLLSIYILFKTIQNKKRKNKAEEVECFHEEGIDSVKQGRALNETDPLLQDYEDEQVAQHDEDDNELIEQAPKVHKPKERPKKVHQEFIAFTILPKQQDLIPGRLILPTLKANGFYLNNQGIFQQRDEENPEKPVLFNIASLVEPGTFNEEEMNETHFPGLLIYMVLSPAFDPSPAFEKMLKNVRIIAAALRGEILDSEQNLLTSQIISDCRKTIKAYVSSEEECLANQQNA